MTRPTTELTRLKHGSTRLEVNTLVPNPFDSLPLQNAINAIGDSRLAELQTKAEAKNWSENRLEAEIRCLAEEVASHANDNEDD